jgi:O-acetyl-ADP-ribose deacetylase (regulator of RNase III)/NAD-dependent SIR2 family protein deacetylase
MSLLHRALLHLIHESNNSRVQHVAQHLDQYESWEKLHLLKQLLCIRSPHPPLPRAILNDIDTILTHSQNSRILTPTSSVPTLATLQRLNNPPIHLKLWQGDITALSSVTAITNAANSQMLGCFQPSHKCIDNVIHAAAGPRLRHECAEIMAARGTDLPAGEALVTRGYCLPSAYVVHTVGPQLARGAAPTDQEKQQLRQCYVNVLEQVDGLPAGEEERKSVALCGISTGLFAFPTKVAARIAVETVMAWCAHHEDTTITEIVFVTFAEGDLEIYSELLENVQAPWQLDPSPVSPHVQAVGQTLDTARTWLQSASSILISAGAGLSAADGLDYTSKSLFKKHFPAFLTLGLNTLYSAIGFTGWRSEQDKWAYYFTNITMARSWPSWPLYERLVPWLKTSGKNVHIRTSNADGLFLANGWTEDKLSTPQGRYSVLQCLAKCRQNSTFDTATYYEAALPFLNPKTQKLTDPSKVPRCPNCGGEMMLCVRGGSWFNETPFRAGEARWREFRREVLISAGETVILELGVGMNTPGVLRWPNEDLVRKGNGRIKLVRFGVGPSAMVPDDLEKKGWAVSIEGDIKLALPSLLPSVAS